jgi:hypothetical protein
MTYVVAVLVECKIPIQILINVSRGFSTRITSERALSQKGQKVRNGLFKYWQENEKNQ